MRAVVALTLATVVVVSAGCGGAVVGTFTGVRAETLAKDIVTENGVERTAFERAASFDEAHDITFAGDGSGNVVTRAFFNVVSLDYLALSEPTDTALSWTQVDDTLTVVSDDGIAGEWVVDESAGLVLARLVVIDQGGGQRAERTTTLVLRP